MKLRTLFKKKPKLIDYETFMLMQAELGIEPTEQETIVAILTHFYKGQTNRNWIDCIQEFTELQTRSVTYKLGLKLDFLNKPAEYFIIADAYLEKANMVALYNHLTGKKIKSMSIQMAKQVKDEFLEKVAHFRDDYEWIYNPPMIGKVMPYTIGKGLRQEFQEYYGAYAEITYLISQAYRWDFDKVNKMKLSEYLAIGEYLLRKRAVEAVE